MLKVVSYETGGAYKASADRLVASGAAHGVRVEVLSCPDRGSWWKNVTNKAWVIKNAIDAATGPVLYLDADCEIVAPLDGLVEVLAGHDLAMLHREGVREPYNSGVMLLANTDAVRMAVLTWAAVTDEFGYRFETCDQGLVPWAFSYLNIAKLPARFNRLPSDLGEDTVIVHRKQSRENAVLSAWKETRRLETALTDRLREFLVQQGAPHAFIGNSSQPPPLDAGEVHYVHSVPMAGATAVWLDNPEAALNAGRTFAREGQTVPVVCPADTAGISTADYLRWHVRPKPTGLNPPANLVLYHPKLTTSETAAWAELCGPNPWTAALNAVAMRGTRKVTVACPDGMRGIVTATARELSLPLTLV